MLSLCPGIQHVSAIPFSLTPAFPFNNFISIRLIRSSVQTIFSVRLRNGAISEN